ncbi:unnamed protein product [Cuscuta epithymum]|uniref:Uncharacterized protein n=1 Tax=Cuscuta epithymum TaxID=186058 RepID=A0AAV0DXF9_9ASTE|nr:unnamed protein product [Cuscuta epithymum]
MLQDLLLVWRSPMCFLAGVNGQMKDDLLALTGFQEGEFPVRYLGIPLAPMRVLVAQYSPLIQKIDGYVAKWKVKSMSYAGRVELIRAVVQDVQSYWLQVFPIPVAILNRIISTCIQFIWDGKSAKVVWCDICKPKEEGGLGLREPKVWNLALIGKTFCNIHSKKDSLWIKWFHGIYLKNCSIWEWSPKCRDSPLLKKLDRIKGVLLQYLGSPEAIIAKFGVNCRNGKLVS